MEDRSKEEKTQNEIFRKESKSETGTSERVVLSEYSSLSLSNVKKFQYTKEVFYLHFCLVVRL